MGLASDRLFERAQALLPGGSTRTTIFFPPHPPYADRGEGAWVWDVDGERRLDVNNNYTSLIHGHSHPEIVASIREQAVRLIAASLPTELELELAEALVARSAAMHRVRFTNSGTEAVMMAIKAARAFTGRSRIAKAEGAYHGSFDAVEVSLDSGPQNWGGSPPARTAYCEGTPPSILEETVVLPFNEVDETLEILEGHAGELAAVIVDPAPTRMGLIGARKEFLAALRAFCDRSGCLLIFDEVISYRIAYGGAHRALDVRPDLVTLGKIVGGGLPVGVVAGDREVMGVFEQRNAKPRVPHGGTFNGNPMTMAAGVAAMRLFDARAIEELNRLGAFLETQLNEVFQRYGVVGEVVRQGSLLRTTLNDKPKVTYRGSYADPLQAAREEALFRALIGNGVLIGRNLVAALSTAMTETEVTYFAERFDAALVQARETWPRR